MSRLVTIFRGRRPLLEGLRAFWELEEPEGARFAAFGDQHLTAVNNPGSASGRVGQAVELASGSLQYLERPDEAALRLGPGPWTVACWARPEAGGTGIPSVLGKFRTGDNQREWNLRYEFGDDRFRLLASPDGSGTENVLRTGAPVGSWYFVVGWWDGSTLRLSLNDGTAGTQALGATFAGTAAFRVGLIDGGTNSFDGRIDQVGLWARSLTAAERTWLYQGGAGRRFAELREFRG